VLRVEPEEAAMDVRGGRSDEAALGRARARWRAAGDRVWSIAMVDGQEYRRVAELVGAVLDEVRDRTPTLASLLALDAEPSAVLERWRDEASSPVGARAVLEAACAVRGDELVASRAREERVGAIERARAAGERWAVLDDGTGPISRSVEMHLATGLTLVATADPYAGPEPYALGEVVLDATTGDPLTGHGEREATFADRGAWEAERAWWRAEIDSRLDDGGAMLSDKRRP
jgi:hypothetical protein